VVEDWRDKTPGSKFYDWEIKGVPIRIEIGPRETLKRAITIVRRDNGKKKIVEEQDIGKGVTETLDEIQSSMFMKAKETLESKIVFVGSFLQIAPAIHNGKVAKVPWCGSQSCYQKIAEIEPGI